MKKVLLTIVIFLFVSVICFFGISQVNAEEGTGTASGSVSSNGTGTASGEISSGLTDRSSSIEGITTDDVVSSEYSFTPRFIKGVTQVITEYNNAETITRGDDTHYKVSNSDAGKIYALYKNVGTYKGQIIDLKITLTKVDKDPNANPDECAISFVKNAIAIFGNSIASTKYFKLEFYDHDSGEKLNLKSNITFGDIDGPTKAQEADTTLDFKPTAETIAFKGYSKILYFSQYASHYNITDYNPANPNACWETGGQTCPQNIVKDGFDYFTGNCNYTLKDDERTNICEVSQFEYPNDSGTYIRNPDINAGRIIALSDGDLEVAWRSYRMGIISSPVKVDIPLPIKTVDKETVDENGSILYTIEQYVPDLSSDFYYSSFKIEDSLPKEVILSNVEDFTKSVSIKDNAGTDVTNKFNLSYNNNTLSIVAKVAELQQEEFYNNTYTIALQTVVIADSSATIKNKAKTIANNDVKESNEVTTTLSIETIKNVPNTLSNVQIIVLILAILLITAGAAIFIKNREKVND